MKSLPIEDYSKDEFYEFKKRYLNKDRLSPGALDEIRGIFNLSKDGNVTGTDAHICCDERHSHNYSCIRYDHPASGIVDRLINEIENKNKLLKKINEQSSE